MDISQLLLCGYRMAAQHCDKCGYPLFEKDGEITCANCIEEEKEGIFIDSNIFIYSYSTHKLANRCSSFLLRVEERQGIDDTDRRKKK